MLTVGELSAGYGRIQVLNGVSFAVAAGEFVGVLGHNGMGKTTLLKTLIGIIRASAGRVTFDGADITAAPSHRRARLGIGYVPQGRGLFPAPSGRDKPRVGVGRRPPAAGAVRPRAGAVPP